MTELSQNETDDLNAALTELDNTVKSTRPKCTEQWQIDLLDEIEKVLDKQRVHEESCILDEGVVSVLKLERYNGFTITYDSCIAEGNNVEFVKGDDGEPIIYKGLKIVRNAENASDGELIKYHHSGVQSIAAGPGNYISLAARLENGLYRVGIVKY